MCFLPKMILVYPKSLIVCKLRSYFTGQDLIDNYYFYHSWLVECYNRMRNSRAKNLNLGVLRHLLGAPHKKNTIVHTEWAMMKAFVACSQIGPRSSVPFVWKKIESPAVTEVISNFLKLWTSINFSPPINWLIRTELLLPFLPNRHRAQLRN